MMTLERVLRQTQVGVIGLGVLNSTELTEVLSQTELSEPTELLSQTELTEITGGRLSSGTLCLADGWWLPDVDCLSF